MIYEITHTGSKFDNQICLRITDQEVRYKFDQNILSKKWHLTLKKKLMQFSKGESRLVENVK